MFRYPSGNMPRVTVFELRRVRPARDLQFATSIPCANFAPPRREGVHKQSTCSFRSITAAGVMPPRGVGVSPPFFVPQVWIHFTMTTSSGKSNFFHLHITARYLNRSRK